MTIRIKPENSSKMKKAQKKSKKYYKWMVEEKPKKKRRFPQMNKSLSRPYRSEFIMMAEQIEEAPTRQLFQARG